MSKARVYVMTRAQGVGVREAAIASGYASGVPSPGARALWDAWVMLQRLPRRVDGVDRAEYIRARIEAKRKALQAERDELRRLEAMLDAATIVA
jgi:hypothetical protein